MSMTRVRPRPSLSLRTTVGLWALLAVWTLSRPHGNLFSWDSFGYHLYLPATFIHQDPLVRDLNWVDHARTTHDASGTLYQISHLADGGHVVKYPMGLALAWSPWFIAGHAIAKSTGHPADGYSAPYRSAVRAGVLIYFLLGLLALRALLRTRFSEGVTAATLALLLLGTNLLDQAHRGTAMPHLPLFALYAGILWATVEWTARRTTRHSLLLALFLGLAALMRPSELLAVLVPFLWRPAGDAANPFRRFWAYRRQWSIIVGVMALIGLPQFLYWRLATGHWIVDTYNNPGEGFDLLAPHTWDFLFSFRKGWYLYTPLMLVATAGLVVLRRSWPQAYPAAPVFFLAHLYLLSSWTCWWYADSFSSRAMVASYALLALPLAAMLDRARDFGRAGRWAATAVLTAITVLNLFQYWQFMRGIIHPSRMTRAAYVAGFGRTSPPEGLEDLLLVRRSYADDPGAPDPGRYRASMLAPGIVERDPSPMDTVVLLPPDTVPARVYRLSGADQYTPAIRIPFHGLTGADHAWVETRWRVFARSVPVKGNLVSTFEHGGRSYHYAAMLLETMDIRPGEWHSITMRYLTPEPRRRSDPFVTYFWSRDTVPVLVDGPHITVWEPLRAP